MTSLFVSLLCSHFLYPVIGEQIAASYLALFLVGQSLIWLFLFSRRDRIPPWLVLLGVAVAFTTARGTAPIFENDHYRYFWDGNQVFHTFRPYALAPDVANAFGLDSIRAQINFPYLVTLYPPLTQFLFGGARAIGGASLDGFLWVLISLGALFFSVGFFRFRRASGDPQAVLTVLWILQHPLLVKEWYQSCHYDVWLAGALVWAFSSRGMAKSFWLAIAANLKLTGIITLAWAERRNWKALVLIPVFLAIPWIIFWRDLEGFVLTLGAFGTGWEMNSGPFRWVREAVSLVLPATWVALSSRGLVALAWLAAAVSLLRSRLSQSEQVFWVLFLMPWLSPVANPWYFTWSLPLATALPPERQKGALALFTFLPVYYFYYEPGAAFLRLWDIEHALISIGISWIWFQSRAEKERSSELGVTPIKTRTAWH